MMEQMRRVDASNQAARFWYFPILILHRAPRPLRTLLKPRGIAPGTGLDAKVGNAELRNAHSQVASGPSRIDYESETVR